MTKGQKMNKRRSEEMAERVARARATKVKTNGDVIHIGVPETSGVVYGKQIHRLLEAVSVAASRDLARPTLAGILLEATPESLTAVATDSYRLAWETIEWAHADGTSASAILPLDRVLGRRGKQPVTGLLSELKDAALVELVMEVNENTVSFLAGTYIKVEAVSGTYPNWRQLLDRGDPIIGTWTFDPDELVDWLRTAQVDGAKSTSPSVELNLRKTKGTIGKWDGAPTVRNLNPKFLREAVEFVAGFPTTSATVYGDRKPLVFGQPELKGGYLLMPVDKR